MVSGQSEEQNRGAQSDEMKGGEMKSLKKDEEEREPNIPEAEDDEIAVGEVLLQQSLPVVENR